jgi:hypothetical protein
MTEEIQQMLEGYEGKKRDEGLPDRRQKQAKGKRLK